MYLCSVKHSHEMQCCCTPHSLLPLHAQYHSKFSAESARFKDFIHVHSFMHDFHLSLLLSLISGKREPPANFDLRSYLDVFSHHNHTPPSFIRNRLCRGELKVSMGTFRTVTPSELYRHLVVHCGLFGFQTIESQALPLSGLSPPTEDICLLINVSPDCLGPTTSPQLSRLMEDTREHYAIYIIIVYQPFEVRLSVCLSVCLSLFLVRSDCLYRYISG